jgi:hypothetical protein
MVCDGVGDLDYSHEAAAYVCRSLPHRVLSEGNWARALKEVNQGLTSLSSSWLDRVASGKGTMATTMMAATVSGTGAAFAIHLAWIGDSEAWLLKAEGTWLKIAPACTPEASITTGRTRALPAADPVLSELDVRVESGTLFLMSDGVGTPLSMNTQVQTTLAEWWKRPPDPFTFASQVAFARKSFMDDRTVVGLWLRRADERSECGIADLDSTTQTLVAAERDPTQTVPEEATPHDMEDAPPVNAAQPPTLQEPPPRKPSSLPSPDGTGLAERGEAR